MSETRARAHWAPWKDAGVSRSTWFSRQAAARNRSVSEGEIKVVRCGQMAHVDGAMARVDGVSEEGGSRRRRTPRRRFVYDRRSPLGRRILELEGVFRSRLGSDADDPVTAVAVRRAAETVALSEDMRARMLRGEKVSADDVLRLSRTADLMTRRLNLCKAKTPAGPTLAELMRREEGAS